MAQCLSGNLCVWSHWTLLISLITYVEPSYNYCRHNLDVRHVSHHHVPRESSSWRQRYELYRGRTRSALFWFCLHFSLTTWLQVVFLVSRFCIISYPDTVGGIGSKDLLLP